MPVASVDEIHYRLATPARGRLPGQHRSRSGDGGFEFRGHAGLLDAPDARRLDLHASLRDPFGQWVVRVHSLRQSITVAVVADLSASMGFRGERRKMDALADFAESLAWSAWRGADAFAFVGCDDAVRPELLVPATRSRSVGIGLAERLRGFEPSAASANGLNDAHRWLGRSRALVFLVSDFHLPLPEVADVLGSLAAHEVVPVVLWDRAEFAPAEGRGLVELEDPESRRGRLVWWRPALQARWRAALAERRQALLDVFDAAHVRPLFLSDGFDAAAVTRHFVG